MLFQPLKYYTSKSSQKGGFFGSFHEEISKGVLTLVLVLLSFLVFSQSNKTTSSSSKIEILNANVLEYEELKGMNVKKLIGNVRLKHDEALMFCDSAYIYSNSNTMDAYNHVRVEQGDSLKIFGDSLKYDGNKKKAVLRGNIRLINNDVTLTTNFLDYNRNTNIAYYYGGGKMVNEKENNTLTSEQGYYYTASESFFFKEDVVLTNPSYKIEADTLNYLSKTEIVRFLGPTTITSDENFIYTENGWYNTISNTSKFYQNAYLFTEKKRIEGDTLYYDRNQGFGEIICNAMITDTAENIILQGNVAHLFELKDSVMITQEALMQQITANDTLFLHADTFIVSTQYIIKDSLTNHSDTTAIKKDTLRRLLGYNYVKFYKKDMQGKADSIVYDFSTSTINFYHEPVIWSKENQITGDFIYLLTTNNNPNKMLINGNAFIISKADSIHENYNQIKGKNMVAYFKNQAIYKIDVKKNAQTIYYAIDEEGKYIGVNKLSGNDMLIFLNNNEIQSITFIKTPEGVISPLQDVSPKDVTLKGFNWKGSERPTDRHAIFMR